LNPNEQKRLITTLKAGALSQGYNSDLWTLGRVGKLIDVPEADASDRRLRRALDEIAHQPTAMRWQPIPDDHQFLGCETSSDIRRNSSSMASSQNAYRRLLEESRAGALM
jgi:hypothetical protein